MAAEKTRLTAEYKANGLTMPDATTLFAASIGQLQPALTKRMRHAARRKRRTKRLLRRA